MTVSVVSVHDGPGITVDQLIGAPMMLPTRVIELLTGNFLDDVVFRDAGRNTNGLVAGEESTPLFLGNDVETVAEFGEIPVAAGQRGLPRIWTGSKRGLGIRVSREMRDENKIDDVNRQIKQLTNTTLRARSWALRRALLNTAPGGTAIPSVAAVGAWGTSGSRIRRDFSNAIEVVKSARPAGSSTEDLLGFTPDAAIIPAGLEPVVLDDDEFLKIFRGEIAGESPAYTGTMPQTFMGLTGFAERFWPTDRVLVFERNTLGFRSDTRPLEATGLYPEGNGPNGGPNESWRSDTTYKRVIGVDQPLAACWITGVTTP